ncbi:SDR family oxidoreductase [Gordonia neofelifaecis]|uniref:Short chain dehydrogenase n=1 Tax=Gordonia neofelifaecis NRRL B-59395 TaxID=644548 RepID=F1YGT4_9ACTN|nr:SDR family oxidoreductase [Gordonia neofelifaecis]EGD56232.1 short chain dehydrogenase [Gordonia neofelifaecis NRRL B-59395]
MEHSETLLGRAAIVTGAGRGIGAGIAIGLADAGADIVLAARSAGQLDEVAEQIRARGRRAVTVPIDLAKDDPAALVEHASAEFDRLDIVVNNVGGAVPKPFLQTSVEELSGAFAFNVGTAHALNLAAVPKMLERDGTGSIINITSSITSHPGRAFVVYGTVKAALAHYTRMAAQDLSPRIRVNGIAPGSIHTPALDYVAANDEVRNQMLSRTPMRRLGTPSDIAAAAVFLASDQSSYLTGKILEVDGGLVSSNFLMPLPDL